MQLAPQQEAGVKKAKKWWREEREHQQVFVVAGLAGTGKSTSLPFTIEEMGIDPSRIAFVAPTGKAARVMTTKLKEQGIDAIATTVHSAIYQPKPAKAEQLERDLQAYEVERVLILNGEHPNYPSSNRDAILAAAKEVEKQIETTKKNLDRAYDQDAPQFQLNPESKLLTGNIELVVADEGSMIGETMAEDLLGFGIPVLVMGDPGQLPPVAEKPGFDLYHADVMLTEIHRQAAENPIIRIAHMVRNGERPDYGDYGNGVLVIPRRKDDYTLDLDREAQVIVGRNKTRWKLTSKMRAAGGFEGLTPQEGEPLIMCKNSRQHLLLVNGTPVFSSIDHDDLEEGMSRFLIDVFDEDNRRFKMFTYQGLFEEHQAKVKGFASASKSAAFRSRITDNHVDFAWAITCHKAQGSQFDEVVIHDESEAFREDADKWLYTGITRAAERLILVC